jgi:hypothetical protein
VGVVCVRVLCVCKTAALRESKSADGSCPVTVRYISSQVPVPSRGRLHRFRIVLRRHARPDHQHPSRGDGGGKGWLLRKGGACILGVGSLLQQMPALPTISNPHAAPPFLWPGPQHCFYQQSKKTTKTVGVVLGGSGLWTGKQGLGGGTLYKLKVRGG